MAMPKKKMSKTRTRTRRSQIHLKSITVIMCTSCKSPKLPHRVCKVCGKYNGQQILDVEKKERKAVEKRKKEEEIKEQSKNIDIRSKIKEPRAQDIGKSKNLIQRTTSK